MIQPPEQIQTQIIPEVVTLPNVQIDVTPNAEGSVAMVIDVPSPIGILRRYVIPMPVEYAENLGKKLTAPRVVVAGPGAVNGNGRH